jgi:CheY-like chemotaxis protein
VDEAVDGKEGLEKFAQSLEGEYSIILMDIQMPVMNGWDSAIAIRKLSRKDARTVPIVTISANAFQKDVEQSLASGMDAHYAKPVQKSTIAEILTRFCKAKQPNKELGK